jgi:predicted component of type VI protein secretion system
MTRRVSGVVEATDFSGAMSAAFDRTPNYHYKNVIRVEIEKMLNTRRTVERQGQDRQNAR